jgi:hypothetical protein
MQDCHTSKTAATKSCSLLTHSSYMGHHSNTLTPHPLASDAIRTWFSHTRRLHQCRDHQWKLQQENITKALVRAFKQVLQQLAGFHKYDKGEIT